MKSRFEHIDASATWQLEWCTTVCSMLIWLWYISVYVVLSWCAAYTCSNAYVRGGFFPVLEAPDALSRVHVDLGCNRPLV